MAIEQLDKPTQDFILIHNLPSDGRCGIRERWKETAKQLQHIDVIPGISGIKLSDWLAGKSGK